MKRKGQISSLAWLFFAIFICIESIRLPLGSFADPDAGFLPLGLGIMLGILSSIDYIQSSKSKMQEARESWYSKERWPKLILVLAGLFVYIICLEILGFPISTTLILIFLFRAIKPQRWAVAVGGGILSASAFYVIFGLLLKVQLPKGIWGF
jgi:putative tricarboxylic transport membrane protein